MQHDNGFRTLSLNERIAKLRSSPEFQNRKFQRRMVGLLAFGLIIAGLPLAYAAQTFFDVSGYATCLITAFSSIFLGGIIAQHVTTKKFNEENGNRKYTPGGISVLIFLCLFGLAGCDGLIGSSNATERTGQAQIEALANGKRLKLADWAPLKQRDQICIIDAYAVRSGQLKEASLYRIFGKLDYQEYRDEIIKRYSDFAPVGFYSVEKNRVSGGINVSLPSGSYLKFAKISEITEPKYFLSGCYHTDNICIWKADTDTSGERPIFIGYCNKNHEGEI